MDNAKWADYYSLEREKMLCFMQKDARLTLEVGCGDGMFRIAVERLSGSRAWRIEDR